MFIYIFIFLYGRTKLYQSDGAVAEPIGVDSLQGRGRGRGTHGRNGSTPLLSRPLRRDGSEFVG